VQDAVGVLAHGGQLADDAGERLVAVGGLAADQQSSPKISIVRPWNRSTSSCWKPASSRFSASSSSRASTRKRRLNSLDSSC